jgi:hypothetical protein
MTRTSDDEIMGIEGFLATVAQMHRKGEISEDKARQITDMGIERITELEKAAFQKLLTPRGVGPQQQQTTTTQH